METGVDGVLDRLDDKQKRALGIGFAVAALLIVAVTFFVLRANTAKSDADSLAAQRQGMGMPDPKTMSKQMAQAMAKELGLDADQTTKMEKIQTEMTEKMRGVFTQSGLSQADRMAKMQEAGKANDAAIVAMLHPDQQTKYAEMQKRMQARMGQMRGGGMPPPGGMPPMGMPAGGMPPINGATPAR